MTAPVCDVRVGTSLSVTGFTCIPDGSIRVVESDEKGELFIPCDEGRHYLDGQIDFDTGETYVGLSIVPVDQGEMIPKDTTVS